MLNNPLKYTDPTGHRACGEEVDDCGSGSGGGGGGGGGGNGQHPKKDKKDTNPSCFDDPNCFRVTQADIIFMSNTLTGLAVIEGLGSAVIISLGLGLLLIGDAPHGIVGLIFGAELLVDGIDSLSTSEYLKTIAQNTKPGDVVEFHKEESLFKTGYYIDGQYATQDTYMPITRIAMEWFAWEP